MTSESEKVSIAEICDIIKTGGTPSKLVNEYFSEPPDGHFWLSSDEIIPNGRISETRTLISDLGLSNSSAKYLPAGSTVMAMVGTTAGTTGILQKPMTTNQNVIGMYPKKELCIPEYLFYYMVLNNQNIVWQFASGAAQRYLDKSSIKCVNLLLPPIKEQERVVSILDNFGLLLDAHEKLRSNIEAIISNLFRSWFIDFDPVKAKEIGKLPYGMDEESAALFPDSLEDSDLGPIPEGWKWGKLGDCVSVVGGGTPSTKNEEFWGGKYNWTSPKDLSNSTSIVMLDTKKTITEEGLSKISSGLLPENTALMSSRAPIGYVALTKIPVAINQGYIAIPPDDGFSPNFILSWIEYNMPLIEAYSSGATFPEISKKEFRKLPILIPPPDLIREFNKKTTHLYNLLEVSSKQANSLCRTRDVLLPRFMSAELGEN